MSDKNKKARSRARRLQRKQNILNGVISESAINESTLLRRASKLSELIVRYPDKVALDLAPKDDAGWIFGRMFLVGLIDREQKVAAENLGRVVQTYRRLLHRYSTLRTSDPSLESSRSSGEDLSKQAEKKWARAQREYDKYLGVLKLKGEKVVIDVLHTLDTDSLEGADVASVSEGLRALQEITS